jgi:nitroimidazol reductase NimA-like FMN-containing flavoprotein (pyridoxamine 5'-phosphate oxidase superfamily)
MTQDERTEAVVLDENDCWRLLQAVEVVRVAVAVAGDVEVFPINSVVDRDTLVFRTAEGTKLAALALNERSPSRRTALTRTAQKPGVSC